MSEGGLVRRGEIRIETAGPERVKAVRQTLESRAWADVACGPPDPTAAIVTPLKFLNHMVDHIAYRSLVTIAAGIEEIRPAGLPAEAPSRLLEHVVCEDLGATLGGAFGGLFVEQSEAAGVNGCGAAIATIDEALARVVVSVEGRAACHFASAVAAMPERVEDMHCCDLLNFLDGFARGMECTLHVDVLKGRDPHHVWESVFRALGEALRQVFAPCERRKGLVPGLKGTRR